MNTIKAKKEISDRDPGQPQKYSDLENNLTSWMGRFLTTIGLLFLVAFGLAYLLGVGALAFGSVTVTFFIVVGLSLILVLLAARALT